MIGKNFTSSQTGGKEAVVVKWRKTEVFSGGSFSEAVLGGVLLRERVCRYVSGKKVMGASREHFAHRSSDVRDGFSEALRWPTVA